MKWIDINEKGPTNRQEVLICAGSIVTAATADCEFYGDGRYYWDGCGFGGYEWEFGFAHSDVTHWAPLPDPPSA